MLLDKVLGKPYKFCQLVHNNAACVQLDEKTEGSKHSETVNQPNSTGLLKHLAIQMAPQSL